MNIHFSHCLTSRHFLFFFFRVRSGLSKETPKCQSSRVSNRHLLWALPRFLTRRTAEWSEWGSLFACGFVRQACQALLFQPLNLCQTVNVLMLIGVSGSAGRCQGEWEAVNKEITYIHRVIAGVCQVVLQRMSSWKKEGGEGEAAKRTGGGSLFYIYVNYLEIFYFPFISGTAITGQAINKKWFPILGDFRHKSCMTGTFCFWHATDNSNVFPQKAGGVRSLAIRKHIFYSTTTYSTAYSGREVVNNPMAT